MENSLSLNWSVRGDLIVICDREIKYVRLLNNSQFNVIPSEASPEGPKGIPLGDPFGRIDR